MNWRATVNTMVYYMEVEGIYLEFKLLLLLQWAYGQWQQQFLC